MLVVLVVVPLSWSRPPSPSASARPLGNERLLDKKRALEPLLLRLAKETTKAATHHATTTKKNKLITFTSTFTFFFSCGGGSSVSSSSSSSSSFPTRPRQTGRLRARARARARQGKCVDGGGGWQRGRKCVVKQGSAVTPPLLLRLSLSLFFLFFLFFSFFSSSVLSSSWRWR